MQMRFVRIAALMTALMMLITTNTALAV